jgi:hypothetical protein
MRPFRLALASFSTSLLLGALAAPVGGAEPDRALRLRLAELESALARKPLPYLVLDPAGLRLTVKSRGLILATVPLQAIQRLAFRPLFGGAQAPSLLAPTVWTVTQGPGDTDRDTIAPTTLKPYSEEEEMKEPTPAPPPGATPTPKPGDRDKPSTYRVGLDNGWQLFLVGETPRLGWFRRFAAAVQDGWQRLQGMEPKHPPLVALVLDAESARGLHHLFRSGTEILVLPAP